MPKQVQAIDHRNDDLEVTTPKTHQGHCLTVHQLPSYLMGSIMVKLAQ